MASTSSTCSSRSPTSTTAYEFVRETVAHGGTILFVGTKKQAQEPVAEQATRVGMPYVNHRWLGGMLTNFQTISKRLARLKELEEINFERGGRLRLHQEGTAHPAAREGQAGEDPRRHPRHEPRCPRPSGSSTPRRSTSRSTRREARTAGHRDPRHQLRPGRGRLQDPGQRRRIRSVTLLTRVIADAVADGLIQRSQARAGEVRGCPRGRRADGRVGARVARRCGGRDRRRDGPDVGGRGPDETATADVVDPAEEAAVAEATEAAAAEVAGVDPSRPTRPPSTPRWRRTTPRRRADPRRFRPSASNR
jgi:small subunit ribosomal protein S2